MDFLQQLLGFGGGPQIQGGNPQIQAPPSNNMTAGGNPGGYIQAIQPAQNHLQGGSYGGHPMTPPADFNPHMLLQRLLGQLPNPATPRQQRQPVFGRDLQPTIELEGVNPVQMQQYGPETNYSTGIQGTQNQGYIPMQGSQGVRPIQGGSGPSINFR